jgi:F-type H+-transporting ATPase subunit a
MADYTFLDLIPQFAEKEHGSGWHELGGFELGHPVMNSAGHVTLSHVVFAALSVVIVLGLAVVARSKYSDPETALVPEGKLSVRNFFETIFDAVYGMMADMMGEKHAKAYFPLIATLACFIFISNLMGLVPGLSPPTQNLNTNLACAVTVFVVYNAAGIKENGLIGHIKHFMGPILWLAPLMFVIEIIGHVFRPISLGIRLTGNMTGDHMVLGEFANLASGIFTVPAVIPIPFFFLGLLVSVIQTLVFCLLSSIYIALAVEHDDH